MAEETKLVYLYDDTSREHRYLGMATIADGEDVPANATETAPAEGATYWNGTAWVADTVVTYEWDRAKDNEWVATWLIPLGSQLKDNETTDAVPQGAYQPTKRVDGKWVSPTKEEWEKAQEAEREAYLKEHPEEAPQPTAEQKQNAAQMVTIAKMQTQLTNLQAVNAKLMVQNAEITANQNAQKAVNAQLMLQLAKNNA